MLRHACFFATCLALQGGAVLTGARADTIGADPSDYATRIHVKAEELGFIQDYDTAPRAARFATPVYPDQALEQCVAGTVMVLIGIDDHGRVVDPEVLESIPELDDAALDCVRKWRFTPAEKDGRPVGTVALVPVSFEPPSRPGEADCRGRILTWREPAERGEPSNKSVRPDEALNSTILDDASSFTNVRLAGDAPSSTGG